MIMDSRVIYVWVDRNIWIVGYYIKEMMETEMEEHLSYQKSARFDSDDYRNGYKSKQVVKKHQKDIFRYKPEDYYFYTTTKYMFVFLSKPHWQTFVLIV